MCNVFNRLCIKNNCYTISCHQIMCINYVITKKESVLQGLITKYYTPLNLWSHYIIYTGTKHERITNHWNTQEQNRNGTYLFKIVFVCFQCVSNLFIQLTKIVVAIVCRNCFSKSMESRTPLNTRKIKFTI